MIHERFVKVKKLIIVLAVLVSFFTALYLADQHNKRNTHPTLNEFAELPDRHLINSIEYYFRNEKQKGIESIEKAIETIWVLEKDMEKDALFVAENVASTLEQFHKMLLEGEVERALFLNVFEYSMNNLAYSELLVSKEYAVQSETENAKKALHLAKSHLLNINIFSLNANDYPSKTLNSINDLLKKESITRTDLTPIIKEIELQNQKIEVNLNT